MNSDQKHFLEHRAYNLRVLSLRSTTQAGSGHPTTCLSAADMVSVLFFYAMRFDPENHDNPNNDRFILSKGHAAPLLYSVWEQLGVITQKELMTLRQFDSRLEGHPVLRFPQSEAATGSLGQGLSVGVGMAYAARMDHRNFRTYVLLGDSEVTEGSVWEAAEIASYYRLSNLIAIVDVNRLGQSTDTVHGHNVSPYVNKFTAFGWHTIVVDGHNVKELVKAFDKAHNVKDQPVVIIAKTFKGHGLKSIEDQMGYHGKAFSKDKLPALLKDLQHQFESTAVPSSYAWTPHIPEYKKTEDHISKPMAQPTYTIGDMYQTRKAYGQALAALGDVNDQVVSLDAEVKNSTYAEIFEHHHPKRFVQCFIAEQNMVGMGVGMAARGKIPFVSTFAAFFTRAYDQVRMAAIGQSPLRLVGSHAGVSIGQDGPSQMGLEDIAMMRAIPNSVVLYPSDAVSTYKLVELMGARNDGITYMRTTRMATPVIYKHDEQFSIGGCKVIRQSDHDVACVVGAGVTLSEALKAYDMLQEDNVSISVIDLYCVKPLPVDVLRRVAKKSGNKIITVEDHYRQGGFGEAIATALCNDDIEVIVLAVDTLPRSGKPEELLAYENINSDAIVKSVKK